MVAPTAASTSPLGASLGLHHPSCSSSSDGPSPVLIVKIAAIYGGFTMFQQLCLPLTFDLHKQL